MIGTGSPCFSGDIPDVKTTKDIRKSRVLLGSAGSAQTCCCNFGHARGIGHSYCRMTGHPAAVFTVRLVSRGNGETRHPSGIGGVFKHSKNGQNRIN